MMEQVEFNGGAFCMDEANARRILINLERYRSTVDKGNEVIKQYNATVKP